jgi:hypothetical protein
LGSDARWIKAFGSPSGSGIGVSKLAGTASLVVETYRGVVRPGISIRVALSAAGTGAGNGVGKKVIARFTDCGSILSHSARSSFALGSGQTRR